MHRGEVESLASLAARTIAHPSAVASQVQTAVAARVFDALGPLGFPVRIAYDGITSRSYRAVDALLRSPLEHAGRALGRRIDSGARSLGDSTAGSFLLGALNGAVGDRLARDHSDLALELTVRHRGGEVPLHADGVAAAFPAATPRLAVFVHGLCGTEHTWWMPLPGVPAGTPTYGARLRDQFGYTPVYVRYNTGLHVSDNGRRLADLLDDLLASWPLPAEELVLIGHSMGGLVSRSAVRYGELDGRAWIERVRHVICLGTPHLGAPLERAANVAGWTLTRVPETRPFAALFFNGRSAGIKDLRYGSCVEEDWCDCDPDEFLRDRCCEVPFLQSAQYYFVGATLSRRSDGIGGLVGDLLVHYRSASGDGRRRRIPFTVSNGRHVGGLDHLGLLNHPAVYDQIKEWLGRTPVA